MKTRYLLYTLFSVGLALLVFGYLTIGNPDEVKPGDEKKYKYSSFDEILNEQPQVKAKPAPVKAVPKINSLIVQDSRQPNAAQAVPQAQVIPVAVAEAPKPEPKPKPKPKPIPNPMFLSVKAGDTLAGLLQNAGIEREQSNEIVYAVNKAFDVRKLKAGQEIELEFIEKSFPKKLNVKNLRFFNSYEEYVEAKPIANGKKFTAQIKKIPVTQKTYKTDVNIESSLYAAAINSGLTPNLLQTLIKNLSFDIDFQRDIREGDRLEALYTVFEDDKGNIVKSGEILYSKLTAKRKTVEMNYFKSASKEGYYEPNGVNIRKSLLMTPIDGARVSSKYGMRKHPILGYSKKHNGVDFAAPYGTPIFAAGKGSISKIYRSKTYGNYIKVKHNDNFSTAYAHMQKFAKGLKKGSKVNQGQIIGYVGSTGRSTGPHLHYEVIENGKHINPQSAKLPILDKLKGKDLQSFKANLALRKKRLKEVKSAKN